MNDLAQPKITTKEMFKMHLPGKRLFLLRLVRRIFLSQHDLDCGCILARLELRLHAYDQLQVVITGIIMPPSKCQIKGVVKSKVRSADCAEGIISDTL